MFPTILSGAFPSTRPGPYSNIGYAFISTPAKAPFTRQSPRFKENDRPALSLKDIGYAVFYPAAPSSEKGWFGSRTKGRSRVDWLASPKGEVVEGYKRFLGDRAYWILPHANIHDKNTSKYNKHRDLLSSGVCADPEFSAYHTASLLPRTDPSNAQSQSASSSSSSVLDQKRYPLVIFSHGLAGTRTTYAQYCSALASEGYVVLSVEHKDGSGPAVTVQQGAGDKDGWLHYTRHKDLKYDDGQDPSLMAFRTMQLELRVQEIYEAYHSFKEVVQGDVVPTVHEASSEEANNFLASLRGKADTDEAYLTGHSFGGATVLSLLQTPPPADLPKIPVKRVIALDPWLEPIPAPAALARARTGLPPVLVANSPGFTEWNGHWDRLVRLVKDGHGWLVTIMNGNHQSFSDFPLLLPPSSKSLKFLSLSHEVSTRFMRGDLAESEVLTGLKEDGGKVEKNEKGKMAFQGDVALHLRGE